MDQHPLDLTHVFDLEPHGPDTYVGESPIYSWGRVYGGLVIAQALWAATRTVRLEHAVHSLHAYFILGGDPGEPVRYEVDRVRNGRSFSTRRVVARQSAGAILNWLSAEDVATVAPHVHAGGEGRELVARLFVLPTENLDVVRAVGKRAIAAYLNVPVYAAFQEWLGRGERLAPMWAHWRSGDRKAALDAIDDELLGEFVIHGSPGACREHVARYVANGLHTPVLALLPGDYEARAATRALSPVGRA